MGGLALAEATEHTHARDFLDLSFTSLSLLFFIFLSLSLSLSV